MSVCEVGPEPWKYSKNLSLHNTLGNQPTPFMYRKKAPSAILWINNGNVKIGQDNAFLFPI